jgi:hypothetical protein
MLCGASTNASLADATEADLRALAAELPEAEKQRCLAALEAATVDGAFATAGAPEKPVPTISSGYLAVAVACPFGEEFGYGSVEQFSPSTVEGSIYRNLGDDLGENKALRDFMTKLLDSTIKVPEALRRNKDSGYGQNWINEEIRSARELLQPALAESGLRYMYDGDEHMAEHAEGLSKAVNELGQEYRDRSREYWERAGVFCVSQKQYIGHKDCGPKDEYEAFRNTGDHFGGVKAVLAQGDDYQVVLVQSHSDLFRDREDGECDGPGSFPHLLGLRYTALDAAGPDPDEEAFVKAWASGLKSRYETVEDANQDFHETCTRKGYEDVLSDNGRVSEITASLVPVIAGLKEMDAMTEKDHASSGAYQMWTDETVIKMVRISGMRDGIERGIFQVQETEPMCMRDESTFPFRKQIARDAIQRMNDEEESQFFTLQLRFAVKVSVIEVSAEVAADGQAPYRTALLLPSTIVAPPEARDRALQVRALFGRLEEYRFNRTSVLYDSEQSKLNRKFYDTFHGLVDKLTDGAIWEEAVDENDNLEEYIRLMHVDFFRYFQSYFRPHFRPAWMFFQPFWNCMHGRIFERLAKEATVCSPVQ